MVKQDHGSRFWSAPKDLIKIEGVTDYQYEDTAYASVASIGQRSFPVGSDRRGV